jgi:hypothetical protein
MAQALSTGKFAQLFACFACLLCLFCLSLHKPMIKKKYLQANSFAGFARFLPVLSAFLPVFAECHLSDIQQTKNGLK